MKCVNIKLWDILDCFHYILNAPRIVRSVTKIGQLTKDAAYLMIIIGYFLLLFLN